MKTTRRRMLISVTPRLFADALSRVLARDDMEVVLHPEPADPGIARARFDLAIVSGTLPEAVSAEVVISVPEDPAVAAPALSELVGRVNAV